VSKVTSDFSLLSDTLRIEDKDIIAHKAKNCIASGNTELPIKKERVSI